MQLLKGRTEKYVLLKINELLPQVSRGVYLYALSGMAVPLPSL